MTEPAPQPEPEPTPEPEPAPEPEPEPEQTLEQAAAASGSQELLEKADKENTRYHKAIAKILGDDPNRHQCPQCDGLGLIWGEPQVEPELRPAEDAKRCEVCDGWGQTETGARYVQTAQPVKPCGGCGGRGWQNVVNLAPVAPIASPTAAGQNIPPTPQPVAGQWVPGRGFIPYGSTEPVVVDPNGVTP